MDELMECVSYPLTHKVREIEDFTLEIEDFTFPFIMGNIKRLFCIDRFLRRWIEELLIKTVVYYL